ncbi:MAG: hypothetical protein LBB50_06985 [Oscillospiraceae bacterium]|nr:hypothetical protein [Oscillospiraceae bacterium]
MQAENQADALGVLGANQAGAQRTSFGGFGGSLGALGEGVAPRGLRCVAQDVLDVTASAQAIAYVTKDTRADGSVFASFYLCEWDTLCSRPISESMYCQMKFGAAGSVAATQLPERLTCCAARLPDGGCAVLQADSTLRLLRPDGRPGAQFALEYQGAPAGGIACDPVGDGDLWFSVPKRGSVVRFSLQSREMTLRVGGADDFAQPTGLFLQGHSLFVCCVGDHTVRMLHLPACTLGESVAFKGQPDQYFAVFRRRFVRMRNALYVCEQ